MVLKQLEIQGFKSFPDKTRIPIGAGITGVVGPNGSGKSNLADAIRWVLGETSSRQLRGAGKMEDVIFGGTRQRGAMGYASVRLTLDNTARKLEVDADEVTIGRRYYRSGESEYTINGQACRLRDVYELLLDTGLGRDGYSIIGQGRIAEIVSAKSSERREIFEEASGIARYRYRKNEAQRRLDAAEANLARLRDILAELQSRVGPLEQESRKAERFLALAGRRKSLEVTLWAEGIRSARAAVRERQRSYEAAAARHSQLQARQKAAEAEAEDIRAQAQQLTIAIERLHADIRSITGSMGEAESRIAVLQNDISHHAGRIAALQQQQQQDETARRQLEADTALHTGAEARLQAQQAQLDGQIQAAEARLAQLEQQTAAATARQKQLSDALSEAAAQRTAQQVAAAEGRAAAQAARARLGEAEQNSQTAAAQLADAVQDAADTAQYLQMLGQNAARVRNVQAGLQLKLATREKALAQAQQDQQQQERAQQAAQSRLAVLQELERNMEGYQNSVKTVMRAAAAGRLRGVVGPVSAVLAVQPGCELAVETALGGALQNIVVQNEAAAKAAIALLCQQNAGRATFLPLDTIQPTPFRGTLGGSARLASSLVHTQPGCERAAEYLLGRVVVVEEINEAARCARSLGYRNKVVTMDGQVINAGGSFTGGSVQRSAGLFTRRQEISALQTQLQQLQQSCAAAQQAAARCRQQAVQVSAELAAAQGELQTLEGDRIRAEAEQTRLQQLAEQLRQAEAGCRAQQQQLQAAVLAGEQQAEAAANKAARLDSQARQLAGELAALADGGDALLAAREQLAQDIAAQKLQQLAVSKDIELHRSALQALAGRGSEQAAHSAQLQQEAASLQSASEACRAAIARIHEQQRQSRAQVAEKEEQIQAATAERMQRQQAEVEADRRARQLADTRGEVGRELASLAERRQQAEAEYDQGVARLWEEYQLTPSAAEELCVPFESLAALRAEVGRLRGEIRALGQVNVGAVEEYREVRARYDTLLTQVTDVEKSRQELAKLIQQLAAQMRQLFGESFQAINGHFGRIFRELFGGGEARLYLEQGEDVLSAGIGIQVAPPGKVIKNLAALSGGEQALVAISIYFAILAVNPAPFCVLDEIDAALDDANVARFAAYLQRIADKTQFLAITHRRGTMEAAGVLYGVTMQEDGISRLLRLDMQQVDATLIS